MIVPMKKLSVLLHHGEKERFLESLRDLGVVHVVETPEQTSEDLVSLRQRARVAEGVARGLQKIERETKTDVAQKADLEAQEVVQRYEALDEEREGIEQKSTALRKEAAVLTPWGDFDPASVARLADAGVKLRFFEMSEKKFDAMDCSQLNVELVNRVSGVAYFVVVEHGGRSEVSADEVLLPVASLKALLQQVNDLTGKRGDVQRRTAKLVAYRDLLKRHLAALQGDSAFESARLSMEEGAGGKVLALTGWLPAKNERKVAKALETFCAWSSIDNPSPEDNVPVQLENSAAAALFEPIMKIYSLPDYFELDPTVFIAPFFAVFFGLCLGDMGYGLLIMLVTAIGIVKAPPKLKPFMRLGVILGGCTTVAGLLLNTFFGCAIFAVPGMETAYFGSGPAMALLTPVETETGTYFPAMPFAMYLGLVQILVATVLKGITRVRNNGKIWALQPLSHISMLCGIAILLARIDFIDLGKFAFGAIRIGPWLASLSLNAVYGFIFGGLAVHMFFNNPNKGLPVRLGLGIWELYQFVSGRMGDSLSYLRLFALGLAGGLLGAAFNQIAFMFITAEDGTVNYASPLIVFSIIILIGGHGLNIALAALGAFVHPLRLTFVEFYNNLEFKWGGKMFRPLSRLEANN